MHGDPPKGHPTAGKYIHSSCNCQKMVEEIVREREDLSLFINSFYSVFSAAPPTPIEQYTDRVEGGGGVFVIITPSMFRDEKKSRTVI